MVFKVSDSVSWFLMESHGVLLCLMVSHSVLWSCYCSGRQGKEDSERVKTPRTDCLLKVYEGKEFYQLGFRFVDLENSG